MLGNEDDRGDHKHEDAPAKLLLSSRAVMREVRENNEGWTWPDCAVVRAKQRLSLVV